MPQSILQTELPSTDGAKAGPLVSVVIPVYNGAQFVHHAVESVLNQTYPSVEIIAINDGSTDDSLAILETYGGRIRIIDQPNAGVAAARNAGINAAQGEFIAFLDQDDWWLPTKLERQIPVFLTDSKIGLVHSDAKYFDDLTGQSIQRFNSGRPEELVGNCYERLLTGGFAIVNSTVIVRRSILDRVGHFSSTIGGNTIQDFDLWLRFAQSSMFGFVPEPLAGYRLHPAQGMWRVRDSLVETIKLYDHIFASASLRSKPEFRQRMVSLLNQVTIAHLEAGDKLGARSSAARSVGLKWSHRNSLIWLLTFAPNSWIGATRRVHSFIKSSFCGRKQPDRVPRWAKVSGHDDSRLMLPKLKPSLDNSLSERTPTQNETMAT